LQQRCEQLEHQVKKLSKDKESLSRQLADESLSAMKQQSLAKRLAALEEQLSVVEAEWFQLLS
jgi:hypothetical protein